MVVGHLTEISTEKGNFEVYVERFGAFAIAKSIDNTIKQDVFLKLIEEAVFITLRNLLFSKSP